MVVKTKYDIGQRVWVIWRENNFVPDPCPTCKGKGRVHVVESAEEILCPKCYGRGTDRNGKGHDHFRWVVKHNSIIGQIDVRKTRYEDEDGVQHIKDEIRYMIEATGIGGGSMWPEEVLFASEEEAMIEVKKRNEYEETSNSQI